MPGTLTRRMARQAWATPRACRSRASAAVRRGDRLRIGGPAVHDWVCGNVLNTGPRTCPAPDVRRGPLVVVVVGLLQRLLELRVLLEHRRRRPAWSPAARPRASA